ncbi:hypothetical protein CspHIS471_0605340 [Cutaneotrichosporon sp. HIS471]|nr:hypothetical protein CspHIS471_0605340 [Cutaneotrichosporon sp. HIS471]
MSLFASAFGSPGAAASIGSAAAGKKRKRPSSGKDDQLRATQANLTKLMERVDAGLPEKGGKEEIGAGLGKKGKNTKKVLTEEPALKKAKGKGKGKKDTAPKTKWAETDDASGSGANNVVVAPSSRFTGAKAARGKPEPFELPMPAMPKAEKKDDGLTDMQRGMKTKLEGARFRWINEQLYSTKSTDAVQMMKKDPKIFADYHLAHRAQTAAWPTPPLPHIVDEIRPLPRGTVIADLGCGDAGLARALVPEGKVVLSYDLVGDAGVPGADDKGSGEGWVVRADFLSHVPLPGRPGGLAVTDASKGWADKGKKLGKKEKRDKAASEVVDVVVCCLSLMGTNWIGGVYEAVRVLKLGGTLHIAEVTSRLVSPEAFADVVASFGLVLEEQAQPSTHFTLFRFTKRAVPQGAVRGEVGWDARVREGEDVLRACVYKKR